MLETSYYTVMVLFLIVCVFMTLVILIQKGRGGGLASAFGGAGGNTAFGSKTGDVLTWATSVIFGIFLILAVTLNLLADHRNRLAEANDLNAPVAPQPMESPSPEPLKPPTTIPTAMAAPTTTQAAQ